MKAIIYARKSSESEEKQVQSIDAQLDWCKQYAKTHNFDVVDIITEEMSAKAPWRPGFNKLMQYFAENKADVIISWKLNRLSRNPIDEWTIKWLCQSFTIKEIHTVDWISNWHNILLMSVHFWMANQFLVDLSKDIKRWMAKKAQNGEWWRRTPLGYRLEDWVLIVDPETAPHIRKIFKLKYEQNLNNAEIARILEKDWLRSRKEKRKWVIVGWKPLNHKQIWRILENSVYYWVISHIWELFEWKHNPLISKEIFDAVNSKEKKKYTYYKKWILKWKVILKETWKPLSVTEKIKTNKTNDKVRKYIYYHTNWDNQIWLSELDIIRLFDKNIDLYSIPEKYTPELKKWLYDYHQSQINKNKQGKEKIEKLILELERKKQNYIDMRASWELGHEEFVELKNNLVNEILDLKERSKELTRADNEIMEDLTKSVELVKSLSQSYKSLDKSHKLQIINLILVELIIDKEKRLYIKEKPLFQFIKNLNNHKWWN